MKSWKILLLFALLGCNPSEHTLGMLPLEGQTAADDPLGKLFDDLNTSTGQVNPADATPITPNAGVDASSGTGDATAAPSTGGIANSPVESGAPGGPSGGSTSDEDAVAEPTEKVPLSPEPDDGCEAAPAAVRPAKLVLVYDSTFQLDLPQEAGLPQVSRGISAYLRDARSTNSYAALFVVKNVCSQLAYSRPDANLSLLPQEAAGVSEKLPSTALSLTQAEVAVLAAVDYATRLRQREPKDGYGVVVISDGFIPGICIDSDASDLVNAFGSGQALDPPMNVYLVSLQFGSFESSQWPGSTTADALAQAGGTESALPADLLRSGSTDVINDALQAARSAVQPCTVDVSEPMAGEELRVHLEDEEISTVAGTDECAEREGFYLHDPTDLRAGFTLCPQTCERLKRVGAGQLALRRCAAPEATMSAQDMEAAGGTMMNDVADAGTDPPAAMTPASP